VGKISASRRTRPFGDPRMTRTALALTASVLALGATGAEAQNKPFRYGTNWVAQAEHGGFYQSVADGTYAACGLDVTIVQGGPQVAGRAMMLAGRLDAFMGGNMLEPFNGLVQDVPLVAIFSAFQKEPQILMTHPGVADEFTDLKNLTLLVGEGGFQSYYQWMISEFGFTAEQRRPYTFNSGPFIADKGLAQQGYLSSEPFAVEKEGGFVPDIWLLADYGFDTYSTTIEVTRETLETRKDELKCFVEGSILGWYNFLYGDNAAAIALIQADNPDMTDDKIAFSIDKMKEYGIVDSGDSLTLGIGAMTEERMQSFYNRMVKAGVLPAGLDIAQSYSFEFINQGLGLDLKARLGAN
jgi:NitT/TauT family transport system substrate-binding protein